MRPWLRRRARAGRLERWSGGGATFVCPEATARDLAMTVVFASLNPRSHVALAVVTSDAAAGDLDEHANLDSFALE